MNMMNRNARAPWLLLLVVSFTCAITACTSTIDSPTIDNPTHMATVDHAGEVISSGPISNLSSRSVQSTGTSHEALATDVLPQELMLDSAATCSCGCSFGGSCGLGGCSSRDISTCADCWAGCCAAACR